MSERIQHWERRARALFLIVAVVFWLGQGGAPPQDLQSRLDQLSVSWTFNFFSWETSALVRKVLYGLLSPQRWMTDEEQSRFVLDYLDDIREADRISSEIDRIYTDPETVDPLVASSAQREAWSALRQTIERKAPIAEAILESQVSHVLSEAGFGALSSVLPPVSGTFTPLPHILVVSPRERIESVYQQQLVAGLTAAEQAEIEDAVMDLLPNHSAYVTGIGGLAAYPAMLLEVSSIDWVTDVIAHEWTHHYLTFYPLGWYYLRSGETRTINETTASIVGEWAGQEVMLRYYEPILGTSKALPDPLETEATEAEHAERPFDFRAEMHHTRVVVDQLLEEGKIEEAERYMEARRRYFVANGYQIRRLNQAYFAFHGAYASAPGAAGEDPIGPLVRQVWAVSETPADFLRGIAPITSLEALQAFTAPMTSGSGV